ncbi:MAG: phosphonoacetaldehyde reductase [Egibacteraceae bacterium]
MTLTLRTDSPRVHIGTGAVRRLGEALDARRVLVVHGRHSFRDGPAAAVVDRLRGEVSRFGGERPNPTVEQVAEAVQLAKAFRPDAVVGIGGGSVMDVAKAVAVLSAQEESPLSCLRDPTLVRAPRRCSLVQVPTISGSGSEMTRFATVYVGPVKYSLDHGWARADAVLIDPDLTASVPPTTAAASALDALCHAVESYWSVAGTAESRDLARDAVHVLVPALADAAARRVFSDPGLRTELARGAMLAGAAIDRTRTTAAHALSYPLTARLGVPHGFAVGLHLRWLVGHASAVTAQDCRHPGGPAVLRGLVDDLQTWCAHGGGGSLESLVNLLLAFCAPLTERPLPRLDWAAALSSARAANHPRLVTETDVLNAKG